MRKFLKTTAAMALALGVTHGGARAAEPDANAIVVIGHASVARIDASTLQRLYTGRAIEVAGNPVSPTNLALGHPLRERFLSQGAEPAPTTPEEFSTFMRAEIAKWGKVIKESGAKVD